MARPDAVAMSWPVSTSRARSSAPHFRHPTSLLPRGHPSSKPPRAQGFRFTKRRRLRGRTRLGGLDGQGSVQREPASVPMASSAFKTMR